MRQGKVAFDIKCEENLPFELPPEAQRLWQENSKVAFETAKTTFAGKAKKAYALALGKKPAQFSTDDIDDVEEARKHWEAVVAGTSYSVCNFRDYIPQSDGQIAVAKVLAWLQSLPSMQVSELIEDMDAASLKAAILGE